MKRLLLIAVGTGRCATGFYAHFLASAGIICGHEAIFSYNGLEAAEKNLNYLFSKGVFIMADASWLAAPYLNSPLLDEAVIVHLIRHPKRCILSWLRWPTSITPSYLHFLQRHLPQLETYKNELDRSAARWFLWNQGIETASMFRDAIRFNIENEPTKLLDILEKRRNLHLNRQNLFDNRKYNTKPVLHPYNDINLNDIGDRALRDIVLQKCEEYGYDHHH